MSQLPPKECVYIPLHLAKYFLIDADTGRIDTSHILTATTPNELLQIIQAIRPHIYVQASDHKNHQFLKHLFTEMAASEIINLRILNPDGKPYLRASLRYPDSLPEDTPVIYSAADKIDGDRLRTFKIHVLSDLRAGRYLDLSDSVSTFLEKYTYLSEHELTELENAKEDLEERRAEDLSRVQEIHLIIQSSNLELRQSNLDGSDRNIIQHRVDGAHAVLKQREEILSNTLRDVAHLGALIEHHK